MARVLDALQQLDTLATRPAGPAIADDDVFLADNGHMVKTHPLAASTARLRLLDMAWEAAPPSTTTTTTSAAGAGPCAPEAAALLSQMIAELRKVLAGYPDQYDAHKRLIGCVLVQARRVTALTANEVRRVFPPCFCPSRLPPPHLNIPL